MTGHRIHFYATREDLDPVIRAIEALGDLKYALTGLHTSLAFPVYSSALQIPSLGHATADSAAACDSYLVVSKEAKVMIREVPQTLGGIRYAVDQLMNPDSIRLSPGGRRGDGVVIQGLVDTSGQSDRAKEMFNLFRKHIKNGFTKRQSFYVGAEAMRLKEQSCRLTMAVQAPREYDLA